MYRREQSRAGNEDGKRCQDPPADTRKVDWHASSSPSAMDSTIPFHIDRDQFDIPSWRWITNDTWLRMFSVSGGP